MAVSDPETSWGNVAELVDATSPEVETSITEIEGLAEGDTEADGEIDAEGLILADGKYWDFLMQKEILMPKD